VSNGEPSSLEPSSNSSDRRDEAFVDVHMIVARREVKSYGTVFTVFVSKRWDFLQLSFMDG
jgi:hypothetical protein